MKKTIKGVQRKLGKAVQAGKSARYTNFYRELLEVFKYKWNEWAI